MERKYWHNTTVEEIIEEVKKISLRYGVKHLFLFGLYAKGTATEFSDIDFAVSGITIGSDYLEEIDGIRTLKRIDIVDYDNCSNQLLKEDIDEYGRKIY